jgi:hypothetical protein
MSGCKGCFFAPLLEEADMDKQPRSAPVVLSERMHVMPMRVGIDLVAVESVRDSLNTHAYHYLVRVFSEREHQDCTTPTGMDSERLAARFAAKEAALKVLRPGDVRVPWNASYDPPLRCQEYS